MALVALVADPRGRARLLAAVRGLAVSLQSCERLAEVRAALRAGAVRALVVDHEDVDGEPTAPLVRDARCDHPSVSLVAYCEPGRTPSTRIVDLVKAGVHALVLRGIDDERHAFRLALREAEQRTAAELVIDAVRSTIPAAAWPIAELYLRRAAESLSVGQAAHALGVHRKTLLNRLQAAGLPPPAELRAWCRLFVAARLLEDRGRTVESVALQLDFPSASALRNLLKRRTGLAPHELRDAGGLRHLLACFAHGHGTPAIAPSRIDPPNALAHVAERA